MRRITLIDEALLILNHKCLVLLDDIAVEVVVIITAVVVLVVRVVVVPEIRICEDMDIFGAPSLPLI